GGQSVLCLVDQFRSLLQLQQVRTPAERTMSDILCTPLRFSLFDVLSLKRIFSPSIIPEYWSQLITLARKRPVKEDN
ncbi:MAG TPA: hypothetical protein VIK28_03395, partial [Sedimentisphaerales bacterium]